MITTHFNRISVRTDAAETIRFTKENCARHNGFPPSFEHACQIVNEWNRIASLTPFSQWRYWV